MQNPFVAVINLLLHEPQASLLNGILYGVKSSMPMEFYQALVATGVLHIIALSGMNISILMNLVSQINFGMSRIASSILSVCLIVVFVLLVGPSPSLNRAVIMGFISILAAIIGRQEIGVLSLFITALIMLLFDISLIKNISFQLSFLATLGIILANKRIKRQKNKGLKSQAIYLIKQNFILTFSAQLFTLPILLYNFRQISFIAPLTNLLIEWAIQPLMVIGLITSVIGWIYLPLAYPFAWVAWIFLTYIIWIVRVFSTVPGGFIKF